MIAFDPWAARLVLDDLGLVLLAVCCALIYMGGVRLCGYLLRDDPPQRVREAEFLQQFVGVPDNRGDGPPLLVGAAAPPSAVLCAACTSHGDRAFCDQFCLSGGHDACCVVWDGCACPPGEQVSTALVGMCCEGYGVRASCSGCPSRPGAVLSVGSAL